MRINSAILGALLFCNLIGADSLYASPSDIEVTFENKSDWAIGQLYLSPTKTDQWGPDQLGEDIINTGESFKLHGIPVGKYDLKIIDEDDDSCIVSGVKIAANESVILTNEMLVGCQAATEEESEDEE